ncbi:MAG: SDR family NAD(P)-dependent oxidoreductase [Planctomycetota bacterium]
MAAPTALVTGASSGLGAAFARRLARDGYRPILVARRAERLEALAAELGGGEVLPLDLARPEDLRRAEERLSADPAPELLINNAGGLRFGAFEELDVDAEEELLRVHVVAAMRLTHAALARMLPAGRGAIVQVASRSAFAASAQVPTYAAAKAFLHRHALGLAPRAAERGVRILSLCPGNVRTELFERGGLDPETIAALAMLEPEQVVDEALAALAAGATVCVPGEGGRDRALRRLLPRAVLRKAAGVLQRLADA